MVCSGLRQHAADMQLVVVLQCSLDRPIERFVIVLINLEIASRLLMMTLGHSLVRHRSILKDTVVHYSLRVRRETSVELVMTERHYSFLERRFDRLEVKMIPMANGQLGVPDHLEALSNPC